MKKARGENGLGLPEALVLNLHLAVADQGEALRAVLAALEEALRVSPVSWSAPADHDPVRAPVVELLRLVEAKAPDTVKLYLEQATLLLFQYPDEPGSWRLEGTFLVGSSGPHVPEALARWIEGTAELCRALVPRGAVGALLDWREGDANCLPEVPLLWERSHLLLVRRERIEEAYEDSAAFREADWALVETLGEEGSLRLFVRAPRVESSADFLAQVQEGQWALARGARPGRTRYFVPRITPEEKDVFYAGDARLQQVGYAPGEKTLEMSCYLAPEMHIRGWEIYQLRSIVERGALATGEPVETVRVVFAERWMAESEKRPLLDVGVQVYYLDENAELSAVVDEEPEAGPG